MKAVWKDSSICLRQQDVLPQKQRHGRLPILSEFEEPTVLETLLDKPGLYLREVQEELYDIIGSWISCPTICHTAKKLTQNVTYSNSEV